MKSMIDLLHQRRSTRKFTAQPVDDQHIAQLLDAGLLAPSSKDTRPVEFVAVTDKTAIAALAACRDAGTMALRTAALAIAVVADTRKSDVWVENAAIAAMLIQLEAEHLGLGSTWVQMRLRTNGDQTAEDAVRAALGIPEHYGVLCVLAVGHKDELKSPRQLTASDQGHIHRDRF